MDNRIGILMTTLLGGLAAAGGVGGIGGVVSREQGAKVAFVLLLASAGTIVAGLIMTLRLVLPRMTVAKKPDARWPRRLLELVMPTHDPNGHTHALKGLASLRDADAAYDYYLTAAQDPVRYLSGQAFAHAEANTGRNWRFLRAGVVIMAGILLALAGGVALAFGW